jgi:hypothetical protein
LEPFASLYQTQAGPILQSSDSERDGGIAKDELKHCKQLVLIAPGAGSVINAQDPLRFLNGGHQRLTI